MRLGKDVVLTVAAAVILFAGDVEGASFSPWTHYDRTGGLAGNAVKEIVRDRAGGLWIGTDGGASHFDGERWQNYTVDNGLPDNSISSIFVDPSGGLWLGGEKGFGLFRDNRWSRLGIAGGTDRGKRVSVVSDREGNTWFGSGSGLMKFDFAAGTLETVTELEGMAVASLTVDEEGSLWVGTDRGLRMYDGTFWEVFEGGVSPTGLVTALLTDSQGRVWCGTENGLAEYDGAGWTLYGSDEDLPDLVITDIAEDRQGRIWVGTGSGAGFYDGYDWVWVDTSLGLPDNDVAALCADVNGSIWIGTSRGLSRYNTSWETIAEMVDETGVPQGPVLKTGEGKVFLAASQGFFEMEGSSSEYVGEADTMTGRATVFLEGSEGDLWIGSDQGLYLYNAGDLEHFAPPAVQSEPLSRHEGRWEEVKFREYDRYEGLKGDVVTSLAEDGDGGVWVGTTEGLSRFADGEWDTLEENETIAYEEVTALAVVAGEEVWVGTGNGLWIRRDDSWLRLDRPGTAGRQVNCLYVDGDGRLWAGTDSGVSRYDKGEWRTFSEKEGLVGNNVLAVYQDEQGRMWFGTDAGVATFDGSRWSAYGEIDGLHAHRITSITGVDEFLWFASSAGVSIYRPDRAPPDTRLKNPPREPVGAATYLFEYAGADLETPPERMRYSWRLDGGDWSAYSPEPRVVIEDLVNGTHEFEVRSMDLGLNVDPDPAAVAFEVNTSLFDLELVSAEFQGLYAALFQYYAASGEDGGGLVGNLKIRNNYDRPLKVKISLFLQDMMDFSTDIVETIGPDELRDVPLRIELNENVLALEETGTRQLRLTLQYYLKGELKESQSTHPVTVFEKHSMSWNEPARIGLYVTHLDEVIENFAREVVRQFKDVEKETIIYANLLRAMELFDALGAYGVRYIADPDNPYIGIVPDRPTVDLIRLPRETLQIRSGDCDDVAVLYAALLENVGINTSLVDVFDHVFIMFDTGLKKHQSRQLAADEELIYVDGEDRIWIPVEVTLVGGSFTDAWQEGAEQLNTRDYKLIEIKESWKKYAPLRPKVPEVSVTPPERDHVWPLLAKDLKLQQERLVSPEVKRLRLRLDKDPGDVGALNDLGILLARKGYLVQSAELFRRVMSRLPSFPGGYSNLGNVLYEQGAYEEAIASYRRSLELGPESPEVNVELALTYCEIGRFDLARVHYERAIELGSFLLPEEGAGASGKSGNIGSSR